LPARWRHAQHGPTPRTACLARLSVHADPTTMTSRHDPSGPLRAYLLGTRASVPPCHVPRPHSPPDRTPSCPSVRPHSPLPSVPTKARLPYRGVNTGHFLCCEGRKPPRLKKPASHTSSQVHTTAAPPDTPLSSSFLSCSLLQPSDTPSPFSLHYLLSPCRLCPIRAVLLTGVEAPAASTTRHHLVSSPAAPLPQPSTQIDPW
jgi:hypothetical protein